VKSPGASYTLIRGNREETVRLPSNVTNLNYVAEVAYADMDRRNAELEAEVKPPGGFARATKPTILGIDRRGEVTYLTWCLVDGFGAYTFDDELPKGTMWLAFAPSKREEELAQAYGNLNKESAELLRTFKVFEATNAFLADKVKELEAERNELKRSLGKAHMEMESLRSIADMGKRFERPAPSSGVEWEEDKEGLFWWVERGKKMAVRHNGKWSWVSERTDNSSTEDVRVRPKGWRP
jgi:hypothetical protein